MLAFDPRPVTCWEMARLVSGVVSAPTNMLTATAVLLTTTPTVADVLCTRLMMPEPTAIPRTRSLDTRPPGDVTASIATIPGDVKSETA